MNATTLIVAATWNADWKDSLRDLWRQAGCPIHAPGQPPSNSNRCKVDSWVRQCLPGVNYFDRPATTILAGSVGMISVSLV